MRFEWDPKKAASNLDKHGVSFDEAASVLYDPLSITVDDPDSEGEYRFITTGLSTGLRVIVVVHADGEHTLRIVSARLANRREREVYEEGA